MPGPYALPAGWLFRLGADLLRGRPRSFRADARTCIAGLQPPLQVEGREYIPACGPCLLTVNHYTRPGLRAWWLALAVSAALPFNDVLPANAALAPSAALPVNDVLPANAALAPSAALPVNDVLPANAALAPSAALPAEIHWLITSAWTYPDPLRRATVTPLSQWVLRRLALAYDFTTLPPMPPDPREVFSRAQAVRRVLRYARAAARPLIGLAPEGGDFAAPGCLADPPPGVGRFILQLCALGLEVAPLACFERQGGLCLRFGPHYRLQAEPGLTPAARDRWASQQVMQRIASLLPALPPLSSDYCPLNTGY